MKKIILFLSDGGDDNELGGWKKNKESLEKII